MRSGPHKVSIGYLSARQRGEVYSGGDRGFGLLIPPVPRQQSIPLLHRTIADGLAAVDVFLQLGSGEVVAPEEMDQLQAALLAYCHRDTMAMMEATGRWHGWHQ